MDEIIFQKCNKRKKLYKKKEELVVIPLTTKEIDEYLDNKNPIKKPIIKNTNNNKIKTKFLYCSESKNFIYYSCFKKKFCCKGSAKINKKNKTFIITKFCDNTLEHIPLEYEEFVKLIEKNNTENIDFTNKIIQKYYVIHSLFRNNDLDINTLYKNFYEFYKKKLILSKSCICKLKNKIIDNFKGLSLLDIMNKIKIEIPELFTNILDIKYDIKIKNKNETREQRIIIFGLDKRKEMISYNNTIEFFIDVTFQIIPTNFRPYKLFVLSGINKDNGIPNIICFILIKYTDFESYNRIFNYLVENYNFKPKIIHSDFERAIEKAIKINKYFDDTMIHSRCFFHFAQMVRKKLYQSGIYNKKFNKIGFEILSNIELLCFLDIDKINNFKKIINNNLNRFEKIEKFSNYINNFIFKLSPYIYNYAELIKYFKDKHEEKFINKLYTTNNIVESVNGVLAHNLPKRVTNNNDFVKCISKILYLDSLEIKSLKRKDYKTRALLRLIRDENLNINLKWVSFDEFCKYLKLVIEDENENINELEKNKLIDNYINLLNEDKDEINSDSISVDNNKISNSSDEEDNIIFDKIENNNKDNVEIESENESLDESINELGLNDNKSKINNFIQLFDNCKIDDNSPSFKNEINNNDNNINNDDKNNSILSDSELSFDLNKKKDSITIKKKAKNKGIIKGKDLKKEVKKSTKKYNYPKDD